MAHFRAMARNAGARPLAEFLVPGSLAIQMEPAALAPRLDQLRRAGRRLATGETPPPALRAAINRPLFGRDRFLAWRPGTRLCAAGARPAIATKR